MKKLKKIKINNSIATIGNFDGFHIGHKNVINILKKSSEKKVVFTFLNNLKDENEIISLNDKIEYFKNNLIDYLIVIRYSKNIKNITADSFCTYLTNVGVKKIVAGSDFKFGLDNKGDITLLKKYFDVLVAPDLYSDDIKVSSTMVKKIIKEGDIFLAKKYLGYSFYTSGKVVRGNKIGRKLGYRTANIDYKNKVIPPNGVYLGYIYISDLRYYTIINIGYNPSINMQKKIRLEAHIINFNKNIYNKNVKVVYLKKLRDEIKFNNKYDLINQLNNDLEESLKTIKEEGL